MPYPLEPREALDLEHCANCLTYAKRSALMKGTRISSEPASTASLVRHAISEQRGSDWPPQYRRMNSNHSQPSVGEPVHIECHASPSFQRWIAESGGAVSVSTYQAGKVAMIGWDGQRTALLMREFDKPLGLTATGGRLALATATTYGYSRILRCWAHEYLEGQPGRYDALYLPRVTYHTGDLHTHDVAMDEDGLLLVATRFSCLARLSWDFSFSARVELRSVSDLVPEDRCHLNGLAMRDGQARYVTALGVTDTPKRMARKKPVVAWSWI